MPPARSQFAGRLLRSFTLNDSKQKPSQAEGQAAPSQSSVSLEKSEEEEDKYAEAEDWIDDGDVVPSHPHIGKRPKQVGAVTGTGVDQAVRTVTKGGESPNSAKRRLLAKKEPEDGGGEQAPHGDEKDGVSELAVKLEAEQWVLAGAYENVEVGDQAGGETNEQGAAGFLLVART
tara:strand:- start:77 stop:601 length:525 start_codon:yes stop_codon:yes gene_type:complete